MLISQVSSTQSLRCVVLRSVTRARMNRSLRHQLESYRERQHRRPALEIDRFQCFPPPLFSDLNPDLEPRNRSVITSQHKLLLLEIHFSFCSVQGEWQCSAISACEKKRNLRNVIFSDARVALITHERCCALCREWNGVVLGTRCDPSCRRHLRLHLLLLSYLPSSSPPTTPAQPIVSAVQDPMLR